MTRRTPAEIPVPGPCRKNAGADEPVASARVRGHGAGGGRQDVDHRRRDTKEPTMKYACLVYFEEATMDAMSSGDAESLRGECESYRDSLDRKGFHVTSAALQPIETATTIRVRNGQLSTTDGPFEETKEQLGGFYLIEAETRQL